jgi:hypothetical protein
VPVVFAGRLIVSLEEFLVTPFVTGAAMSFV